MTLKQFVSGTKAKASEINDNFIELDERINTLGSDYTDFVKKDGTVDFTKAQSYAKHIITGASNATPIVITSTNHGRSNGDVVLIKDVAGNTAANGTWVVANKTDNTYQLAGSVGNGAYTSGGTGYLLPQNYENLAPIAYVEKAVSNTIIPLGTVSTGTKTMTVNHNHTANFTGSSTLAVPSITTIGEFAWCYIEFTTSNASYPTFPTVKWDNDYTPTFSTTRVNCVFFRTTDNGTTWRASYKFGGA